MKITATILISILYLTAYSQVVADFENFNLDPGQYNNNASPSDGFESGSIILPNYYDAEFAFWSGFAISADTNTTTPGFLNQYSSIVGQGAVGTTTYAMGYIYDPIIINLKENAIGKAMIGMYVSNSTYGFMSMRDGDAFAKKFGGESGKDPDYFVLTVKKYSGGVIADDSINVYLADYRFSNSSEDYILSDWKYIDLSAMGEIDSLILGLRSSDNGLFGMNTPAYVAIDQVSTDNLLAAAALNSSKKSMTVAPNPAHESIYMDIPEKGLCTITSIHGTVMWSGKLEKGQHKLDVSEFPKGIFFVTFDGQVSAKICIE